MKKYNQSDQIPILLSLPEVIDRVNISKSRIYSMMNEGIFPRPIKNSGMHRVSWLKSDIAAYIAKRIEERNAKYNGGGND